MHDWIYKASNLINTFGTQIEGMLMFIKISTLLGLKQM